MNVPTNKIGFDRLNLTIDAIEDFLDKLKRSLKIMLLNYTFAWFGLMVIAILNGTLRTFGFGKFMPEIRVHQLSTLTGIIFVGIAVYYLNLLWPIQSSLHAVLIGIIWLGMTITFEFIFGHYIMKHAWKKLFNDYRIDKGRVWGVFLIWVLISPLMIYLYL